jgi:putative oxygen-independent coproporphyrinogen III oxidase
LVQAAYIHIPFCVHICHYCDFNKVFIKGQPVDDYLKALQVEMERTIQQSNDNELKTVFVGGGTPTSLSQEQLKTLLTTIRNTLPIRQDAEITFEANPGDLTEDKLMVLREGGVNRLSLGVQSFDEQLLKKIGRTHHAEDVYRTVENAKKSGFQNISIDLMYGLPGQTLESFVHSLQETFQLNIQHVSSYSLIVEPKTVFYNLMRKGKLHLPSEDDDAKMYETLLQMTKQHGFHQYEISNFAKRGFESKHNLTYWNNEEYYGFGAGAHSYVDGVRKSNIGPVNHYIQQIKDGKLPILEETTLTLTEKMEEEMFLGLRKTEGVCIENFQEKFKQNPLQLFSEQLESLKNKGLIDISSGNIKLTKKGMFLGNEVFQAFIGVI